MRTAHLQHFYGRYQFQECFMPRVFQGKATPADGVAGNFPRGTTMGQLCRRWGSEYGVTKLRSYKSPRFRVFSSPFGGGTGAHGWGDSIFASRYSEQKHLFVLVGWHQAAPHFKADEQWRPMCRVQKQLFRLL